jgi:hypothetical protein
MSRNVSDQFYLELPELTFDRNEFISTVEELRKYWKPCMTPVGVGVGCRVQRHVSIFDRPHVKSITDKLAFELNAYNVGFLKLDPGFYLPEHVDAQPPGSPVARQAVIMFPITPLEAIDTAPIRWFREGELVMEHHYSTKHATIINAQENHSVQNNANERISFQISLYEPFADCVKKYREGTFYNNQSIVSPV